MVPTGGRKSDQRVAGGGRGGAGDSLHTPRTVGSRAQAAAHGDLGRRGRISSTGRSRGLFTDTDHYLRRLEIAPSTRNDGEGPAPAPRTGVEDPASSRAGTDDAHGRTRVFDSTLGLSRQRPRRIAPRTHGRDEVEAFYDRGRGIGVRLLIHPNGRGFQTRPRGIRRQRCTSAWAGSSMSVSRILLVLRGIMERHPVVPGGVIVTHTECVAYQAGAGQEIARGKLPQQPSDTSRRMLHRHRLAPHAWRGLCRRVLRRGPG